MHSLLMDSYFLCLSFSLPVFILSNEVILLEKVEGMEVGLTLGLGNHEGTLKLSVLECGCYVKDISIHLDGGASWLYQGYGNVINF